MASLSLTLLLFPRSNDRYRSHSFRHEASSEKMEKEKEKEREREREREHNKEVSRLKFDSIPREGRGYKGPKMQPIGNCYVLSLIPFFFRKFVL